MRHSWRVQSSAMNDAFTAMSLWLWLSVLLNSFETMAFVISNFMLFCFFFFSSSLSDRSHPPAMIVNNVKTGYAKRCLLTGCFCYRLVWGTWRNFCICLIVILSEEMFFLYLFVIRRVPCLELNIHTWLLISRQSSLRQQRHVACCRCAWAMRCDGVGVETAFCRMQEGNSTG